ncbi:hypothetical protein C0V75_03705 [Tabrizicola sp. TH137]|uniref:VPLPA-CTERM sorting domain-containing protein n=1 Tax=Tabrizicola sp. TH137 TaxID=2067452 RepID=UPI000C7CF716|nr:VPLPA-CTERM sorting domain-containing protein [Tabrizicola sp. TH137]PLL14545.1 hypothetical protein C0V75_03705 [Tabrizicola sp. TH137]
MKKFMLAAALALSTLGVANVSNAAVIDSGDIDVRTSITSPLVLSGLTAGNQYFLTISGTAIVSGLDGRRGDAEYFQRTPGGSVWSDTSTIPSPFGTDVGVEILGLGAINWGAFNPSHTYQILYTAASTSVSLFFRDVAYNDNSGTLQASISAVPLPASMLGLLAGLAGLGFLRRRKTA